MEELGPRRFEEGSAGLATRFAAWITGLLTTGGIGLGLVFILSAHEGEVRGISMIIALAAAFAGSAVTASFLEVPTGYRRPTGIRISLVWVLLPGIGLLALSLVGQQFPVVDLWKLVVIGLAGVVGGTYFGGWLTRKAREIEERKDAARADR